MSNKDSNIVNTYIVTKEDYQI